MTLFALCCTADIPVEVSIEALSSPTTAHQMIQRINYFLEQTYHNSSKLDCQPSLLLISALHDSRSNEQLGASQPPITSFQSPFVGKSIEDVARSLSSTTEDAPSTTIDPNLFAILDEKSRSEDFGLIVQVKNGKVDSVRVHLDTINAELIRVQMITFNIGETKGLVGEDGVFRTKPPEESRKGGSAPRKKLG